MHHAHHRSDGSSSPSLKSRSAGGRMSDVYRQSSRLRNQILRARREGPQVIPAIKPSAHIFQLSRNPTADSDKSARLKKAGI